MICLAYSDITATDVQPFRVSLSFSNAIVSEMLILEGDEGFASEVTDVERRSLVESKFLAKRDILFIEDVNLVGNVRNELSFIFFSRFILGQIFLNKLFSEVVQVFYFCEIVADSDGWNKLLVKELVIVRIVFVDILPENKFPEIFFQSVPTFTLIFIVFNLL